MNGRVGNDIRGISVIGKHGENRKTNNRSRLLEYCLMNNLMVTNTFYEQKNIHKYTRQARHIIVMKFKNQMRYTKREKLSKFTEYECIKT